MFCTLIASNSYSIFSIADLCAPLAISSRLLVSVYDWIKFFRCHSSRKVSFANQIFLLFIVFCSKESSWKGGVLRFNIWFVQCFNRCKMLLIRSKEQTIKWFLSLHSVHDETPFYMIYSCIRSDSKISV